MASVTFRTTVALPAELLHAVDEAVRQGVARSRNDLVARALRRELADIERAAIDAAFGGMPNDTEYAAEVATINAEFAQADWEALHIGERQYAGRE